MLDLSRFTDALSNLFGGGAAEGAAGSLMAAVNEAGLDVSQLQNLAPDQIMDVLAQNGIDVANFAPEQLQGLMGQLGQEFMPENGLGEMASSFFGGDRDRDNG